GRARRRSCEATPSTRCPDWLPPHPPIPRSASCTARCSPISPTRFAFGGSSTSWRSSDGSGGSPASRRAWSRSSSGRPRRPRRWPFSTAWCPSASPGSNRVHWSKPTPTGRGSGGCLHRGRELGEDVLDGLVLRLEVRLDLLGLLEDRARVVIGRL